MGEANKVVGAGLVMSAGIASTTLNGVFAATDVAGIAVINITKFVAAGDEGWDVDGNYVCSKFLFNFTTMQLFDGSETHAIDDVLEVSADDVVILLKLRDRIAPKRVFVGLPHRVDTVQRLISDMWEGITYVPDTKKRLRSVVRRMRVPRIGTLIRYSVRSILLGVLLTLIWKMAFQNQGSFRMSEYYTAVAMVFSLSMAWRLLRPIKTPSWRRA